MGGMFGDLKKLNTQHTESAQPQKAASPHRARNSEKTPGAASPIPPERTENEYLTTTTPLSKSVIRKERETQPTPNNEDLPANPQTSKPASQQTSLPANQQGGIPPYQQVSKPVNPQASKPVKKFTSYLSEESIRALKRLALDEDKKDYEVLQAAVDAYLQKNNS
jgi:hypothetical protein